MSLTACSCPVHGRLAHGYLACTGGGPLPKGGACFAGCVRARRVHPAEVVLWCGGLGAGRCELAATYAVGLA